MEQVAARAPGLPRDNPTVSYWQQPPDAIADTRTTTDLPPHADVVIVGSGISGATVAYNLLKARPDLKVVLVEARQAASGASGRNGGHTKGASYRSFMENIQQFGLDDACRIAKLEYDCMAAVHAFINEHNIPCDAMRCDTVDVFYSQHHLDEAHMAVKLMEQHLPNHPVSKHTFYTTEQTNDKFFAHNSLGSVTYEAGSLSAYKLTIGVLKLALGLGLNLQTNTPVTSISSPSQSANGHTGKSATLWTAHTARGSVTSPTLLLATNGYTSTLLPEFQGTVIPFRGIITAQRPGQSLPQAGFPTTYSFIYPKGYEYMITRPANSQFAGDIVIGGGLTKGRGPDGLEEWGNSDDTMVDASIQKYLTDVTVDTFFGRENWGQDHSEGRVRHCWSGVMGYSADGCPLVGEVPGQTGLWLDVSFQGHGMVLCFLCARAVSAAMLGREKEEGLEEWFPRCYWVNERRMGLKFEGKKGGHVVVQESGKVAQDT